MSALFSVGFPTGMEGLTYPIPFSNPEDLVRIAQRAEALGYHSVWGNDHMTTQHYVRAEFPVPPRFWEPLVTYAYLAAHTRKLRFGTGVLVLPMRRDIVVTAKQIATLDHLSNGRAEIGVGIGAYREEFEALNPDGKVHRGDMVEEGVKALRLLFSQRDASFDGKYYKFRDVELFPKAEAGRTCRSISAATTRRICGAPPNVRRRLDTGRDAGSDTLRRMVAELKEMTEAAGRKFSEIADRAAIHRACRPRSGQGGRAFSAKPDGQASSSRSRSRRSRVRLPSNPEDINLVGSIDTVIARAMALREAGVTHFLGLFFAANSVSELVGSDADFRRRSQTEDHVKRNDLADRTESP